MHTTVTRKLSGLSLLRFSCGGQDAVIDYLAQNNHGFESPIFHSVVTAKQTAISTRMDPSASFADAESGRLAAHSAKIVYPELKGRGGAELQVPVCGELFVPGSRECSFLPETRLHDY
jgi:hypothetical protein